MQKWPTSLLTSVAAFRSSVRLIKPGHGLFRTPSQFASVSLHMSASGP